MIETNRLNIKHLLPADAEKVSAFESSNRDFMAEFAPTRPDNFYSSEFWQEKLSEFAKKTEEDIGFQKEGFAKDY